MLISEITSPALSLATVRPKESSSPVALGTANHAGGNASRASVIEQWGTQTLTPDQLKLKSLADQKVMIGQRQKEERARQKLAKAQKTMQLANRARAAM